MIVRYIQDVQLPETWGVGETFDPMHPEHGPLPDLQGVLESEGDRYTVAVWDTGMAILTFLELIKDESADVEEPPLPLSEAHKSRGWIAQTYRWLLQEGRGCVLLVSEGHQVSVPPYPEIGEDEEWTSNVYRRAMMGSVHLARTTPPGIAINSLLRLQRALNP